MSPLTGDARRAAPARLAGPTSLGSSRLGLLPPPHPPPPDSGGISWAHTGATLLSLFTLLFSPPGGRFSEPPFLDRVHLAWGSGAHPPPTRGERAGSALAPSAK